MTRLLSLTLPAAALLLSVSSTAAFAQSAPFGDCCARYDFAVSGAPRAIAAADLNGDGWTDLVLGTTSPAAITVLISFGYENGDEGQRYTAKNYAVGGGPFEIALGDLNRDGWIDIAVANADADAITLLFNQRNGDFGAPINLPFPGNPRGIAIGDFNRDSIPDIVATKYMAAGVEILYGAGDGTFPQRFPLNAPVNPQGVTAGNFDHDGWGDFAVASASGTIRVYRMFATGAVVVDLNPAGVGWNVIANYDFDRDGRQDLAVASTGSSIVQVLYNRTSGWAASPQVPVAASPRGIAAGDVDDNGTAEIVVAGRSASMITIVTRAGNGTFTTTNVPAGAGARTVALADLDNSIGPDIATANESGRGTTIWYNRTPSPVGAFAFERSPLAGTGMFDEETYAVADFNHNGKMDLLVRNRVYLDGTTMSRVLSQRGGFSTRSGVAADVNRDGHPDAVFTDNRSFRVYFGDGQGNFTDGPATATRLETWQLLSADLNRDGRVDLVALSTDFNSTGALEVFLGRGDGTFIPASDTTLPESVREAKLADFDRDGILDAAIPSRTGVHILLGQGNGTWKSHSTFEPGVPRYGIDAGDVTGDGRIDLVMSDMTVFDWGVSWGPRITVARGNGDGTFENRGQHDVGAPGVFDVVYSLHLADMNADGTLDIFTTNGHFLPNNGIGTFDTVERFSPSSFMWSLVADYNGDGLNDLIGYNVQRQTEGNAAVLLNTRRTAADNRAPTGLFLRDREVWPYEQPYRDNDENWLTPGDIVDDDLHALRVRWTLADGTLLSENREWTPQLRPGTYAVTVTVDDYRGGSTSDDFTLEVPPFQETVLTPGWDAALYGAWQSVDDPTAAERRRVWHPDAGAPKQVNPLANPANFFEMRFVADPTQEYKLWVRMKAESDYWANDSVFVQFTGATDASGNPIYEIGTTSAMAVNLEECSGCGVSGWGWEDDGWGSVNANGTMLRFPAGGVQVIRVQTREDGVSIDQIVLSAVKYRGTRPGAAKNDTTILFRTGPFLSPPQR